jgi:hypothetical protein
MDKIKINYQKIANDISKGYDVIFNNEFPEAKETIEAIKKKPKCGGCLIKNIPVLFGQPNFEEKLKLIYGDDVEYDLAMPKESVHPNKPGPYTQAAEILEFTEEEWKDWWEENMKTNIRTKFQHIATYYKPETKTVVVSIVYHRRG